MIFKIIFHYFNSLTENRYFSILVKLPFIFSYINVSENYLEQQVMNLLMNININFNIYDNWYFTPLTSFHWWDVTSLHCTLDRKSNENFALTFLAGLPNSPVRPRGLWKGGRHAAVSPLIPVVVQWRHHSLCEICLTSPIRALHGSVSPQTSSTASHL